MAQFHVITGADERIAVPTVRTIGIGDLKIALSKGLDDFLAMPSHVVFISLIYPIIGLLLARATLDNDLMPLLYPLAAGFALIGPVAAIGLYEMSRRRERGLPVEWKHAFDIVRSPSMPAIAALAILLTIIFLVWVTTAHQIYQSLMGVAAPKGVTQFIDDVFTTRAGLMLIVVGNGVGFLFALGVLMISVVSFPMLVDRDVGAAVAVATSIKAVLTNPVTMAVWGLIIAAALVVGSLPFFVGLAVVVPVLGHASWHLYRRVVAW
jgi:uncharacterized membrane protein